MSEGGSTCWEIQNAVIVCMNFSKRRLRDRRCWRAICGVCLAAAESRTARDVFAWAGGPGRAFDRNRYRARHPRHVKSPPQISSICRLPLCCVLHIWGWVNKSECRKKHQDYQWLWSRKIFLILAEEQASVQRAIPRPCLHRGNLSLM